MASLPGVMTSQGSLPEQARVVRASVGAIASRPNCPGRSTYVTTSLSLTLGEVACEAYHKVLDFVFT